MQGADVFHRAGRVRIMKRLVRRIKAAPRAENIVEHVFERHVQRGEGVLTAIFEAADVVGEAKGNASGNALRWQYVLSLLVDGKVYEVDFDDWMFQMDDKIMMNRSAMSKWGFHLGDVTLTFVRR